MWVQDYLADTSHLDATEHGVYHLLLYRYWLTDGQALPEDTTVLRRIARCRTRSIVERILGEFWELSTGEGWHHRRARIELRVTRDRKVAASHNAKKRWKINDQTYADASNPQCSPTPTPKEEEKKEEDPPSVSSPRADLRFAEWWSAYPNKVGKKSCLAIWKRRKLDEYAERLINDVTDRQARDAKWVDGFVPNPQTYLNGDRWEDEIKTTRSKGNGRDYEPKADAIRRQQRERYEASKDGRVDEGTDDWLLGFDDGSVRN